MKSLYAVLLGTLVLSGQALAQSWTTITASGQLVTQQRAVGSFESVSVSGGMQVVVEPASSISVQVKADDNIQEYVLTEVSGNRLNIKYRNNVSIKGGKVTVLVGMPRLNGVSISGSGTLESTGNIPASDLKASISGSGSIRLKTTAQKVDARISGSGNIEVGGTASALSVDISGSGSFKGFGLQVKDASVQISGSGNVETFVNGPLDAKISGSGSVYYKGNADISLKTSGSGKLKRAD